MKQKAIETGWYLPGYYSHVVASAVILVIGFFQVFDPIRRRLPFWHRTLGKVYIVGILGLAAPGALIMSFFINRGPWVFASFISQVSLWYWFTIKAYQKAKLHDYRAHELWMWRSFALTLAAITLRIYIFIFSFSLKLTEVNSYAILAWLSWVPNLMIVEWYFQKRAKSMSV